MIPKNPYKITDYQAATGIALAVRQGWDEGFDALKAWLFSRCTDHQIPDTDGCLIGVMFWHGGNLYFQHRYQCPKCMAELKENHA